MRRKIARFFSYLTAISLIFINDICSADQCVTKAQTKNAIHTPHMDDKVGHCSAFAFRAAINEINCSEKKCHLPAVLDIIPMVHPKLDIEKLAAKKALADESCQKYYDFFREPDNISEGDRGKPLVMFGKYYDSLMRKEINEAYDPETQTLRNGLFKKHPIKMSELSTFQTPFIDIFNSQFEKRQKEKVCPKRAYPPINIAQKHIADKTAQLNLINSELQEGRKPVVRLDGLPIGGTDRTGNHFVVVANTKTECCYGICTKYYQLIDPLNQYWSNGRRENGWLPERDLKSYLSGDLFLFSSRQTTSEPGQPTPPDNPPIDSPVAQ